MLGARRRVVGKSDIVLSPQNLQSGWEGGHGLWQGAMGAPSRTTLPALSPGSETEGGKCTCRMIWCLVNVPQSLPPNDTTLTS